MLRVERFGGCEVIRNGSCRFAKHIRRGRVERDIANGKGILKTFFLTASQRDELATVSRELSRDANVLARDKAALQMRRDRPSIIHSQNRTGHTNCALQLACSLLQTQPKLESLAVDSDDLVLACEAVGKGLHNAVLMQKAAALHH